MPQPLPHHQSSEHSTEKRTEKKNPGMERKWEVLSAERGMAATLGTSLQLCVPAHKSANRTREHSSRQQELDSICYQQDMKVESPG